MIQVTECASFKLPANNNNNNETQKSLKDKKATRTTTTAIDRVHAKAKAETLFCETPFEAMDKKAFNLPQNNNKFLYCFLNVGKE